MLNPIVSCLFDFPEPILIGSRDGVAVFLNSSLLSLLALKDLSVAKLEWEGDELSRLPLDSIWPAWRDQFELPEEFLGTIVNKVGDSIRVNFQPLSQRGIWRAWRLEKEGDARPNINPHAQRLEMLGLLTGGIAHDMSNLLTGVLGHVSFLKNILPGDGTHTDSLRSVENGAKRLAALTKQILTLARTENGEQSVTVDLGQLVVGTCQLLRGAISKEYSLRFRVPEGPVLVAANESKLAQIITNLVVNSRDAVSPPGLIDVTLEEVSDASQVEEALNISVLPTASYARLAVVDNGRGMSEDVRAKIFAPFFSTKGGSGLGLGIVRSILQEYGGGMAVFSEEGVGTSVNVYLPLITPMSKPSAGGEGEDALIGGNERVLVVDDEFSVRSVLVKHLEHLGYKVESVASGREAIDLVAKRPADFALVVLDMIMPGMPGREAFHELRRLNPELRVLICSGYASDEHLDFVMAQGAKGVVRKPFTLQVLAAAVRKGIDS